MLDLRPPSFTTAASKSGSLPSTGPKALASYFGTLCSFQDAACLAPTPTPESFSECGRQTMPRPRKNPCVRADPTLYRSVLNCQPCGP
jgi:hypothetical protein